MLSLAGVEELMVRLACTLAAAIVVLVTGQMVMSAVGGASAQYATARSRCETQ